MASSIETDETAQLISSDKVEGTAVYNRDGERLGSIHTVMIGKLDGQVEYAVLSFGGFLGIGNDYYPLPWDLLSYDEGQGGYVVDLTKEQLGDAPRYAQGQEPTYDQDYRSSVYNYYGVAPTF